MASISDIRSRPKFFVWKKNFNPDNLCAICKDHQIVTAVKWGCDFIITTDLQAKEKDALKTHIHAWCISDKDKPEGNPPSCFREYQDAGYV
jgi:hypothetical protein